MMVQDPLPLRGHSTAHDREAQIMRAILYNCEALGIAPGEAKRMAIRSIVNLRRAQNIA